MNRLALPLLVGGSLAFALTIMLAILGAQAGYSGFAGPFSALGESSVRSAVALSLITATVATLLALLVGIPVAYGLSRYRFPGRWLADLLIDLPMVLSPVALGISLLLFFRTAPGRWIELEFIRFVFEVPGVVLAQFVVSLAICVRVIKAGFDQVDERYEQVSRFLGHGPLATFRRVTVPLAKKSIIAGFILGWARSIGEFGATVTLAGAVSGKTETIPVAIYLSMASADMEEAVALIMVLTGMSLAVLIGVRLAGGRG